MTLYLQNFSNFDKTIKLENKIIKIEKNKEIIITESQMRDLLNYNRKLELTISTKSLSSKEEVKNLSKSKLSKSENTKNNKASQSIEAK